MLGNSGDELTNMWGLIATGITVAGIGLTLSHRIWRGAFFFAGGCFVLAGLFWTPIRDGAPSIGPMLTKITSNPSNWFLVLILAIAALWLHQYRREQLAREREAAESETRLIDEYSEFRDTTESRLRGFTKSLEAIWGALNEIRSTPSAATISVAHDWVTPSAALDDFFPEEAAMLAKVHLELFGAKVRADNAFVRTQDRGIVAVESIIEVNKELRYAKADQERIERSLRGISLRRIEKMREELEAGNLIAQGFSPPLKIGAAPITISKEEWRVLQFDQSVESCERAFADGLEYIALRIARPHD